MRASKLEPPAKIAEKLEPGFCQDQAQYIANHVYQPLKECLQHLDLGIDGNYSKGSDLEKRIAVEEGERIKSMQINLDAVEKLRSELRDQVEDLTVENTILKKQNEILKEVLIGKGISL